jgi:hypothetical protein
MTAREKVKLIANCVLNKPAEGLGAITLILLGAFDKDFGTGTMALRNYAMTIKDCMNQQSQTDTFNNTDVNQTTLVGSLNNTDVE